ncbi:hypothetical protein ACFQH8_13555 [Halomicroarcula sp. GCM10025710]
MHGQSGQYLSVSMPNTFSMSEGYVSDYIEEEGLEPPRRDVFDKLETRLHTIYHDGEPAQRGHAVFGDARDLPETLADIDDVDGVDLIFTSPPYLKVLKYGLYNWIRLWFLDEEPDVVDDRLDDELDLEAYLEFMTETFAVADEVLDSEGGVAAFVIGDVDQGVRPSTSRRRWRTRWSRRWTGSRSGESSRTGSPTTRRSRASGVRRRARRRRSTASSSPTAATSRSPTTPTG